MSIYTLVEVEQANEYELGAGIYVVKNAHDWLEAQYIACTGRLDDPHARKDAERITALLNDDEGDAE